MTFKPLAGLALIILGAAALAWPEFSYTKANHEAQFGPMEFTVKEKETLRIPVWASLAAMAVGIGLIWREKR